MLKLRFDWYIVDFLADNEDIFSSLMQANSRVEFINEEINMIIPVQMFVSLNA